MPEIIDLSMEVYDGMPVHKVLPSVHISTHATHEEWDKVENPKRLSPSVNKLEMSEHTGTHVDALSHMSSANYGQTIDTMPLSMFYTEGICLDFSDKQPMELIEACDIQQALIKAQLTLKQGDTILFFTDHYRKHFNTPDWPRNPGISAEAARWLGLQKIAAFGVESMAPGVSGVSNKEVHKICGEMGFTHYENMVNLHKLVGRGRFQFIGLPLKIRGGTGSPVRAIAVFQ